VALSDNLIAFWPLNEASGNAIDAHGSNDLVETSGTIGSATGTIGLARDFEAADTEYFEIADNADLSTGDIDFTFAGWVEFETLAFSGILSKDNDGGGQREHGLWVISNALRWFVSANGIAENSITSSVTLSTGTKYFFVVWHDATNDQLGVSINAGTADTVAYSSGLADRTAPFRIGAVGSTASGIHMDGLINRLGFWKRVLTSAERTELYNGGSGRNYAYITGGSSATFSADRPSVLTGSGTVVVPLTGTDTTWTGTPFSLTSPPTGWSIASQSVTNATTASITLNRGSGTGTITISDGTSTATTTATVTAARNATGNWSTASEWDVGSVPGSGHRATSDGYDVTLDANTTVGTSGSAPSSGTDTASHDIVFTNGATLTLAPSVTLTLNGYGYGDIVLGAGSSVSVSGWWSFAVGQLTGPASGAQASWSGGRFVVGASGTGHTQTWRRIDFEGIGDASNDMLTANGNNGSTTFSIDLCSFDDCGEIELTGERERHVSVTNCYFSNPASTYSLKVTNSGGSSMGTRLFDNARFRGRVQLSPQGFTVQNNTQFQGDLVALGLWTCTDSMYLKTSGANGVTHGATFTGNWLLAHDFAAGAAIGNPNWVFADDGLNTDGATADLDDNVIECTNTDGGGNVFFSSNAPKCHLRARRNLLIRSALASGVSGFREMPGVLITSKTDGTNTRYTLEHNTAFVGRQSLFDAGEHMTDFDPMVSSCKSNLVWSDGNFDDDGPDSDRCYIVRQFEGGGEGEIGPAANFTHNGKYLLTGTGYNAAVSSGTAGANDVAGDPQFVEERSILTWANSLGKAGTDLQKINAVLDDLLTGSLVVSDYLTYVRAGYAPQNALYEDAGHDAVTIGAVEYQAPATGNRRRRLLLAGAG
jgi:hypothetical protein